MSKDKGWVKICITVMIILVSGFSAYSQALLPHITVYNKNGTVHISWISGYVGIKQIGVQRSQDSLFNYSTIGFAADPNKKVNEFIDHKPQGGKTFYRLFILFTNSSYFFSDPASPTLPSLAPGATPNTGQSFASPSIYVYTNAQGNVNVSLPQPKEHHYEIRFYNSDDQFIFNLKNIERPLLILDKSNFLRAGWYHYELYDNDKLMEKWKFYIGDSVDKK